MLLLLCPYGNNVQQMWHIDELFTEIFIVRITETIVTCCFSKLFVNELWWYHGAHDCILSACICEEARLLWIFAVFVYGFFFLLLFLFFLDRVPSRHAKPKFFNKICILSFFFLLCFSIQFCLHFAFNESFCAHNGFNLLFKYCCATYFVFFGK